MKVYSGTREERMVRYAIAHGTRVPAYKHEQFKVEVSGKPLDPHFEVIGYTNVLSEAFEWGGLGSRGEYQLAVAILTDAYGPEVAKRCVTQFAREVVKKFMDNWSLTEGEVFAHVLSIEMETRDAPVEAASTGSLPYRPANATLAGCGLPPALPIPVRTRRRRARKPLPSPPTTPLSVAV